MPPTSASNHATRELVSLKYAEIVDSGSCCAGGSCCGPTMDAGRLATAIGYDPVALGAIPAGVNLGLSCGNPGAIAALRAGETVLDLGSGAGFDCFLCGPKVGASGRVIGVDMTPAMLSKARASLPAYQQRSGLDNVEFRLGEIEHLPLADASVDVVISNCVINLSPDKPRVLREIARVLKPGGRVAVSDMALFRPLPEGVKAAVEAYIGCIAGAALIDELQRWLAEAGLVDIAITPKPEYVATLVQDDDPLYRQVAEALPAGTGPGDFITSVDITARRSA